MNLNQYSQTRFLQKARSIGSKLLMTCLSLTTALSVAEIATRFLAFDAHDRQAGVERLWTRNDYVHIMNETTGCAFEETIIPHPFLGYVHARTSPCGNIGSNNRGVISKHDLPSERDPSHFTIMILGGSVSEQLASGTWGNSKPSIPWLEDYLRRNYKSPNGKPFRVVNGALGGWALPSQLIMISLYGGFVDAAISIDGYNEGTAANGGGAIDTPNLYTYMFAAQPIWALRTVGVMALLRQFKRVTYAMPFTKSSFLFYFIWRKLISAVQLIPLDPRTSSLNASFQLPQDWSREKRDLWNRNRYKTYIRQLHGEASALGIKYAHFLQPMPLIDKDLTEEERSHEQFVSGETYEKVFVTAFRDLASSGLPLVSLTGVFKGIKETIYSDHIHCKFINGDSPGYILMSKQIGRAVARLWNLKPLKRQ